MSNGEYESKTKEELIKEIIELQSRFDEAEENLNAIRNAEIDAIVTHGPDGPHIYTLESADYLYRVIIQDMNEGAATLTSDGTIFYSNAQLASMIQVPIEKITGQRLNDFILPEDLGTFQTIFEKGLENRSNGEISIKSVDGTIIPVHISINSLKGLKGVYTVITDLRQQKHHEELKIAQEQLNKNFKKLQSLNIEMYKRNAELQAILDIAPIIIWIAHDPDCRIITGNKYADQIMQVSNGNNISLSAVPPVESAVSYKVFHDGVELKPEELPAQIAAFTGKPVAETELELVFSGGRILTLLLSSVPLFDKEGRVLGSITAGADITHLKQTEKLLKKSEEMARIHLEKLERTLKDLRRSNEDLQQFAYVASHDLQEPLRMVTIYTQLLERKYKGLLDSTADDYINFIVDAAKRMQSLIEDLLTYSRITTRAKEFKLTNMNKVLEQSLLNLKTLIDENKAFITADPLPEVMVDASQFIQVFQNLVGNAIKFRSIETPKIKITAQKSEDEWTFQVKDNGIGIKPKYHERIFEVFQRLHQRDEYPGTGIGLAICKKTVERHGGRIWIESKIGKGSTFYFTIPRTDRFEKF
jgi:PAS domain S-box-containing protein